MVDEGVDHGREAGPGVTATVAAVAADPVTGAP